MKKFVRLFSKREKTVIGVLSGTSVDAVDVVLVKIYGSGVKTKIKVIDFISCSVTKELKDFIIKCSAVTGSNVEDICKLNFIISHLFAASIKRIISKNNLDPKDIDLIGSHGQTIYHFPFNEKLFNINSKSTLQVGDPSVIANQTGITTVGDFRVADVAVDGEGAPLIPYLDFILYNHKTKNRVFLNIGGISNVTYLKKSCKQNEVIAFDTGPGNMIIDSLMEKFYGKKFDKNGRTASSGKFNIDLFNYICRKDKFHKRKPPKSTGREYYNKDFINDIISKFRTLDSKDIISTFTKFTAYAVYKGLKNFPIDELIISGGGAKNTSLINNLKEYFKGVKIKVINDSGINADNKEAVLFAVLANELVSGNKANLTSVTGSERNVFLGKICIA